MRTVRCCKHGQAGHAAPHDLLPAPPLGILANVSTA